MSILSSTFKPISITKNIELRSVEKNIINKVILILNQLLKTIINFEAIVHLLIAIKTKTVDFLKSIITVNKSKLSAREYEIRKGIIIKIDVYQ